MKTYVFKVMLEPDEEGRRPFYPAWEHLGASTCPLTQEEARKNIQEVLTVILEEFEEEGAISSATEHLTVTEDTLVAIGL